MRSSLAAASVLLVPLLVNALPAPETFVTLSAGNFFEDEDVDPKFASIVPIGTADEGDATTYQIVWPASNVPFKQDLSATLVEGAAGYTFMHTLDGVSEVNGCIYVDQKQGIASCLRLDNGVPTVTGTIGVVAYATVTLNDDASPSSTSGTPSSSTSGSSPGHGASSAGPKSTAASGTGTSSAPAATQSTGAGIHGHGNSYGMATGVLALVIAVLAAL